MLKIILLQCSEVVTIFDDTKLLLLIVAVVMKGERSNKVVSFNKWADNNPYTIPGPNYNNPTCAITTSNGNDWKSVDCNGPYHIVCMRGVYIYEYNDYIINYINCN